MSNHNIFLFILNIVVQCHEHIFISLLMNKFQTFTFQNSTITTFCFYRFNVQNMQQKPAIQFTIGGILVIFVPCTSLTCYTILHTWRYLRVIQRVESSKQLHSHNQMRLKTRMNTGGLYSCTSYR